MRILETDNYEQLSALAAEILGAQVLLKPHCVLGLATGSSPVGAYQKLAEAYRIGRLDFSQVHTVNLDEYWGLSGEDAHSYRYFMEHHLFRRVNLKPEKTFLPDGAAADPEEESRRYEALVQGLGGVDLQLLGIGHNGHIGFNEPGDSFPPVTHPVALTESTIQANARLFDRPEDVPTHAITMGVGTILKAHRILLIAGADKRGILEKALTGKVTPWVPASVLQLHRDVTVIVSKGK